MVLVPALWRWWQLSLVKDSTDSLSYHPLPEACLVLAPSSNAITVVREPRLPVL